MVRRSHLWCSVDRGVCLRGGRTDSRPLVGETGPLRGLSSCVGPQISELHRVSFRASPTSGRRDSRTRSCCIRDGPEASSIRRTLELVAKLKGVGQIVLSRSNSLSNPLLQVRCGCRRRPKSRRILHCYEPGCNCATASLERESAGFPLRNPPHAPFLLDFGRQTTHHQRSTSLPLLDLDSNWSNASRICPPSKTVGGIMTMSPDRTHANRSSVRAVSSPGAAM